MEFGRRFAVGSLLAWLAITLMWWALAFAPLPAAEDWLARARAVCFGTLPNGLPDTWGWGALIISPLAMLGLLIALFGRDLRQAVLDLADRKSGLVAIGLVAAIPLAGILWVGQRIAEARTLDTVFETAHDVGPLPASYPTGTELAPDLDLVDQRGEIVSIDSLRGKPTLVTFAFGHCVTMCPVVVKIVREAAAELPPGEVSVVIVSLDPWRDTVSSLPTLTKAWQVDTLPEAHVLTGDVDEVLGVLEAWNMPIQRDEQTGDISHPGLITIIAPDGTRAYSFSTPPTEWVVEAVRRVMNDSAPSAVLGR